MWDQLSKFKYDLLRLSGRNKLRILILWLNRSFWAIFIYRLERGMFLTFGNVYSVIRIPFLPVLKFFEVFSNAEINYRADIGKGFLILHSALGIVITGYAQIGDDLTLTGGNVIGSKDSGKDGDILLGNNCFLGANAVILGPLKLADNIKVGASACVVKSCLTDGSALGGVPAKEIIKQ
ncbi:serine O-acetyltransferase [Algoriphagus resistens]|uniref:serine O-acetyltransferase n=1 Tax=Algoriphagus resistens TaxID=1750590 RepID=UPI000716B964|nr:hypothetical protein [Algoriphagus resistens]